jgi:hypothetical protein
MTPKLGTCEFRRLATTSFVASQKVAELDVVPKGRDRASSKRSIARFATIKLTLGPELSREMRP